MCLAQGPQRSDAGEARSRDPSVSSQAEPANEILLPVALSSSEGSGNFLRIWAESPAPSLLAPSKYG